MKFQSAIQSGGLNSNLQTLLQFPVYFFRFTFHGIQSCSEKAYKKEKGGEKK